MCSRLSSLILHLHNECPDQPNKTKLTPVAYPEPSVELGPLPEGQELQGSPQLGAQVDALRQQAGCRQQVLGQQAQCLRPELDSLGFVCPVIERSHSS